jgi:hypothetical protein
MMRRCLCALSLALLPVAAHAVCSPGALRPSQWTADYVYLMPDSTLWDATSTAASAWGGCVTTPNHPGFPYPTLTPVSGAPYAVLHTVYHAGFNPGNNTACGRFPGLEGGQYVDVFESAKDPEGHTVTCASFGYDQIIEHELGHYFGLADIFDANCSDIMAQLDGSTHYVGMNDCDQANQLNHPLDRDNPVDYSCNQTCYTNCYGGRCPALNGGSPIVIDLDGDGFKLSGPGDPVYFDLYNNGSPVWTAWTARWSDTAFLALDLDGNGNIDNAGELFGNHTRLLADGSFAKSGYEALAQYDELINGGNGNGVIDPGDAVFDRLRIWIDWNHNGKTDPGELQTLAEAGIVAIDLRYWPSHKVDRYGNQFFLRGRAVRKTGDHAHYLTTYDVFFVPAHRQ